jgi:hypothetical protein
MQVSNIFNICRLSGLSFQEKSIPPIGFGSGLMLETW